ncbi:hypothetical protein ACIBJE_21300 [Micromonospora sp. NPDC050187]|uniref:hypothetical protein n=1 Tax=Micromonospora sp. NPDC050187 TaxID=3364277 RepID=UPI0037ACA335
MSIDDNRYSEAEVLDHLGDAYHAMGDHRLAGRAWQGAVRILDQYGHAAAGPIRMKLDALRLEVPCHHSAQA